ncbi:carboxy terminal-processing peptidase [Marinobacterium sedimentorum]|uniref:carboxy terminal-processing peptidase n=1 Tax=Marinobacterium sedimentorum TaxID=2927804 RepID=UPI0020C67103|nr:carboxy terminal-processing peptidase [Marinobacterium sedimentorum]MCP8686846.1 carboxy terminal-processing peptidase [Marinobacterium sedimentorum]
MLNRTLFLLPTLALSFLLQSANASSTAPEVLAPEAIHRQTTLDILDSLTREHYNKVTIDDSFSSQLLDQYLEDLDPSKSYFYASDVAEFKPLSTTLDDSIQAGELKDAYDIFNRYQQRMHERLTFMIAELESGLDGVQFDFDETLDIDRTNANWIKTQEEMDKLWRKRLKNAALSLKLADKNLADTTETLLKRYRYQLHRAEQMKSEDVFQTYINAVSKGYDPHTQYFSPRNSENFQINMSLSLEGIGAVLQSDDEFTKIVRLVPSGPADKTGQLKASDTIVAVAQGDDGEMVDIVGWRLDDVVDKIRGPADTVVRLQVDPAGSNDRQKRKEVRIVRSKVKLEEQAAQKRIMELDYQGQNYRLGVIEIPAFYIDFAALQSGDPNYKSTTRDVEKLIKELTEEGIQGLVIDLRDNGGGSLREANELVGLFISRGPTVQIRDPNGRIDILGDYDADVAYNGPLAVLVNRLSASASEIFAGAIQDYRRGAVVGSQTFGKGTVQSLHALRHGQLKMTHAKFYRISGDSTQHKGVVPDITLPSLYNEKDIGESALEGALPWDQVREVRHGKFIGVDNFLDELNQRHLKRVQTDPDFIFMREQVEHLAEAAKDKTIPLNETVLRRERDEAEQWQLDAQNRRRTLKQQPPLTALTELEDELKKDEQGRPISPESTAQLEETGRILLDMVDLTFRYTASAKE